MRNPTELDALYAFLVAAAVTALLTPLTMRFARLVGAIDEPRERGLSERPTPLLGGLAIFAGVLVAALIWLPEGYYKEHQLWYGVLFAAALITLVGALDDRFDLPPAVKLAGQIVAAVIVVHFGVAVKVITLPFLGSLAFPNAGAYGLVASPFAFHAHPAPAEVAFEGTRIDVLRARKPVRSVLEGQALLPR